MGAATAERPVNFNDSAVGWFVELVYSQEHGEYRRAIRAEEELRRLGWDINFRPRRKRRAESVTAK